MAGGEREAAREERWGVGGGAAAAAACDVFIWMDGEAVFCVWLEVSTEKEHCKVKS